MTDTPDYEYIVSAYYPRGEHRYSFRAVSEKAVNRLVRKMEADGKQDITVEVLNKISAYGTGEEVG